MSRNFTVMIFISFFMAIATLYLNEHYSIKNSGNNLNRKLSSLKPANEILVRTAKLLPPMKVTINKQNNSSDNTLILETQISVEKVIPVLNYEWSLPEGVEPLGTSLVGTIQNASPRQPLVVTANFKNNSNYNQLILLNVWAEENGKKIIETVARYNTHVQEHINIYKNDLVRKNTEYIKENNIQHKKFR